jgi:hypothetical protein
LLIDAMRCLFECELEWRPEEGPSPLSYALRIALAAGSTAQDWAARLRLIIGKRWGELLRTTLSPRAATTQQKYGGAGRPLSKAALAARARHYMIAGNKRRAVSSLAPPLPHAGEHPVAAIARLFPPEPSAPRATMEDDGAPSAASEATSPLARDKLVELIGAAIGRMARLSRPGPSGLRPEYLRIGWDAGGHLGTSFRAALADLISGALDGTITGPALTQSTLALIPKPDGTLRPIGMGELVRRIAARIVMRRIHADLELRQMAHGQHLLAKDGATLAYRRVVRFAQARRWVLQIDIRNAFNEVARAAVIASAPSSSAAAPLIRALYGTPTLMYSQHREAFCVTRGVIQGCPLGSALFAEALAPAVQAAYTDLADVSDAVVDSVWYADDGHFACDSVDALGVYFSFLQRRLLTIGLTVNTAKCRLLCPLAHAAVVPAELVDIQLTHNIHCLGGPVISVAHPDAAAAEAAAWDELVTAVSAVVKTIGHMPDPQHVVALLATSGAWSRVQYHATARGGMPEHVARQFEEAELSILRSALPPSAAPFDAASLEWRRATTARRDGGLGLRSVVAEAAAMGQYATQAIDDILDGVDANDAKEIVLVERNAAMARRIHELKRELAAQPLQAALLNDLAEGRGTGILNVTARPSDGTLLGPTMARIMLALMIGASFVDPTVCCTACSDRPLLTPHGTHAVSCRHIMYPRHNGARDALYRQLRSALGAESVTRESTRSPDGDPIAANGGPREVDFGYCIGAEWLLFDVIFTAQVPPDSVGKATGSRMAIHARQLKSKAQASAGTSGVEPLAFGALGGMDTATRNEIAKMATASDASLAITIARLQAAAWLPALRSLASTLLGRDKASDALLADKTNSSRINRPHRRRRKAAAAPITHQSPGMAATSDHTPDRQRPQDIEDGEVQVQAPIPKRRRMTATIVPRSLASALLDRDTTPDALLADKTNSSRINRPHRRRRKAAAAPITHQSPGMAATSDHTPDRQRPQDIEDGEVQVQAPIPKISKMAATPQPPRLHSIRSKAPAHRKMRKKDDSAQMRHLCLTVAIWAATTPADATKHDPLCQQAIGRAMATTSDTYTDWNEVKKQAAEYMAAHCDLPTGIISAYGCSFPTALTDNYMQLQGKRANPLRQWTEALVNLESPTARTFLKSTLMAMDQPRALWTPSTRQQIAQDPSMQVNSGP